MTDPDRNPKKIVSFPARGEPAPDAGRSGPLTFEEALAAELDSLHATALHLMRDEALAEDLVQETALRAFRSFRDLRSHDRFRAWLFTILHNAAKNLVRDAARQVPIVDIDLDTLLEDPLLAESEPTPEQVLLRECLPQLIEDALNALPGPMLQVFWLVDAEEFTIAETAGILGVPAGTVASRLHRARRAVRESLQVVARRPPRGEGETP